ncbi:hypothetical protein GCM10022261_12540 [Brevibacterium daeguense]|uniref:Uncharacterized protein n=1 Tax=Brevibacterium daeguense TaxID=909936 RepID=A0ABP8EIC9_9MICO|nr:DEAD/DEAH box helicase [Brevibacterium daeguense]
MSSETPLPYVDHDAIVRFVGRAAADRARVYSVRSAVREIHWDAEHSELLARVQGTDPEPYSTRILLSEINAEGTRVDDRTGEDDGAEEDRAGDGRDAIGTEITRRSAEADAADFPENADGHTGSNQGWGRPQRRQRKPDRLLRCRPIASHCSCFVGLECKHAAAVLYSANLQALQPHLARLDADDSRLDADDSRADDGESRSPAGDSWTNGNDSEGHTGHSRADDGDSWPDGGESPTGVGAFLADWTTTINSGGSAVERPGTTASPGTDPSEIWGGPNASDPSSGSTGTVSPPTAPHWRSVLSQVTAPAAPVIPPTPLAIGFELKAPPSRAWYDPKSTGPLAVEQILGGAEALIEIRPLKQGHRNRWIRGGLDWRNFLHSGATYNFDPEQVALLGQLYRLNLSERQGYPAGDGKALTLSQFSTSLVWSLLAQIRQSGIEFVGQGNVGTVALGASAQVRLDVRAARDDSTGLPPEFDEGDLSVRPFVEIDDTVLAFPRPIGTTGFAEVQASVLGTRKAAVDLLIAPLAAPVPQAVGHLLGQPPLRIPRAESEEFLHEVYPQLRTAIPVVSDESVDLPEFAPPNLRLRAEFGKGDALTLRWSWEYHDPDREVPIDDSGDERRDTEVERTVLDELKQFWPSLGEREREDLTGIDTAEFTEHILPELESQETVEVEIFGERPDYREARSAPRVSVSTGETSQTDWFDLGIEISIDGRVIPFVSVFKALANGQDKLLLPDKTYFSLDHPAFEPLRKLIAEAEALGEWEPEAPKISRYQISFWDELEELADETEQALSWRRLADGLRDLTTVPEVPVPDSVRAQLRHYQVDGFRWLAFLYDHSLGGILADDMGLGKTLQTLALIAHARQQGGPHYGAAGTAHFGTDPSGKDRSGNDHYGHGPAEKEPAGKDPFTAERRANAFAGIEASPIVIDEDGRLIRPPFLVVAPASVVSVWRSEAARFVPDLRVKVLDTTSKKRGTTIVDEVANMDIVVTSYALLRLDQAEFAALEWDGLVLDEAQFVKNRQSRVHLAAKSIPAPFRLAITGTPMENSLEDLWSLLSITAPGLFASASKFRSEYIQPIASGRAPERMQRLRRRVKPFMLRRSKNLVAADLPTKQEQVTRVELLPRHRKLYEQVLQRERKKVLGLVKDLDRNRFIVFRSLTLLRMMALDPVIVDEKYRGIPSSKLEALFADLDSIVAEGHRVVVFSQFTSFLGRIGEHLTARGVAYDYLDGATRSRAKVVESFKTGTAPIFLISLKAGGFGLTLTEADYVFLLDPWWNPAAEAQAVDRTHRIGQTRNVMVYRMVAAGTIEEKVLDLQQRKREMFTSLMDDDTAFSDTISAADIKVLFDS